MRQFKPKTFIEWVSPGQRFDEYFEYLADYIIEYFAELAMEIKKETSST